MVFLVLFWTVFEMILKGLISLSVPCSERLRQTSNVPTLKKGKNVNSWENVTIRVYL